MSETIVVFVEKSQIHEQIDKNFELPARYDSIGNMLKEEGAKAYLCLVEDIVKPRLPATDSFNEHVYYIQHNSQSEKGKQLALLKERLPGSIIFRQDKGFSHVSKDGIWESIKRVISSSTSNEDKETVLASLITFVRKANLMQSIDNYIALWWLYEIGNEDDKRWANKEFDDLHFLDKDHLEKIDDFNDKRLAAEGIYKSALLLGETV